MAIMPNTITLMYELRPCLVDGKRALWHRWIHRQEIIPPSIMQGGHGGGQVSALFALVEYAGGTMEEVYPERVRFLDTLHKMAEMEGAYMLEESRKKVDP